MLYYLIFRLLELLLFSSIIGIPVIALVFVLKQFKKYYSKVYIVGLLFLVLLYFNKLFLGFTLAQPDFNRFLVPFFDFFGQSVRSFSAPLWNPNFGYGFDNWRIFTAPFFGPFTFLSAFFEVYTFLNIYLVLQHFLLLLGGFVFGKTLKMKNYESFAFAIFWAFNGWVCMRFNQGVGYEYLISYKWIPWALASVTILLNKREMKRIISLGICMGFLFEGTPNVGIFGVLLISLYFLLRVDYRNFKKYLLAFCLSSLVSIIFFLPKLLPALLAQNTIAYSTRLVWDATGWRAGLIALREFPKYFLPFNGNGVAERGFFTPGLLGFLLFLLFFVRFLKLIRNKKLGRPYVIFLTLLLIGVILSTENVFSSSFWQLPILRKVTRIPTSLIFISASLPFLMTTGFDLLVSFLEKIAPVVKKRRAVLWVFCGLCVFLEVLVGIKLFGIESYTFDFLKFKPKEEIATFGYLDTLSTASVYAISPADMVMPLYVSSVKGIYSLNTIHYFLGNLTASDLLSKDLDKGVLLYNPEFILSIKDVPSRLMDLQDLYTIDDYKHMERSYQMDRVKLIGKWDGDIRVYRNINYDPVWKSLPSRTNEFLINNKDILDKGNLLPLSFNPYWVNMDTTSFSLDNASGLVEISTSDNEQTHLLYFPWVTYVSFIPLYLVLLFTFVFNGHLVLRRF